jgi:hypothetical protein
MLCLACPVLAQAPPAEGIQHVKKSFNIPADKNTIALPITGSMIDAVAHVYYYDGGLPGGRNIRVDVNVKNRTTINSFYSVDASFLDMDGNLVCSAGFTQVFALQPGRTDEIHLEMPIPRSQQLKIASCQIVFYDGPQTTGKL